MKRTVGGTIMLAGALALALGAWIATRTVHAQDETKTVKADDFESALSGWTAIKVEEGTGFGLDADSKLSITNDAGQVKVGKGALFYPYEVAPKTVRLLALQREMNLTGMRSLRFWVKCSVTTVVIFGLNEKSDANYQAFVYCPAGRWQEVVLNLNELTLDDESKDSNKKLDLDQIASLHLADIGGFLVNLLPDIKGSRVMWIDDIVFSSQPVAVTSGMTKTPTGKPIYLVDNFETPVIRWTPISLEVAGTLKMNFFDSPVAVDLDASPGGGKQSLKFTYTRQAMKIQGWLRGVERVHLAKATGLNLWLKTSRDGTFMVSVEEKDESRYQQVVELKSGDGWKQLSYPLSSFNLAEDSNDENGKLDADQIKEISVADITALFTGDAGSESNLWVDEVHFTLGN